jgi:hypothetical protein
MYSALAVGSESQSARRRVNGEPVRALFKRTGRDLNPQDLAVVCPARSCDHQARMYSDPAVGLFWGDEVLTRDNFGGDSNPRFPALRPRIQFLWPTDVLQSAVAVYQVRSKICPTKDCRDIVPCGTPLQGGDVVPTVSWASVKDPPAAIWFGPFTIGPKARLRVSHPQPLEEWAAFFQ